MGPEPVQQQQQPIQQQDPYHQEQPQTQPAPAQVQAAQAQPQQTQPPAEQQVPPSAAATGPPQSKYVPGPPFAFVPDGLYEDQNVQLWATYYASGGTDPTGSVYFISVPGVKDADPSATTPAAVARSETQDTITPGYATSSNPAYGASPYGGAGEQGQYQGQYQAMSGQFAGMSVGAEHPA